MVYVATPQQTFLRLKCDMWKWIFFKFRCAHGNLLGDKWGKIAALYCRSPGTTLYYINEKFLEAETNKEMAIFFRLNVLYA